VEITVAFAARAIEAMRSVALEEILPRYRTVVATRKSDGTLVTEADIAAQHGLARKLQALDNRPFLGEEMPAREQSAIWEAEGPFWCVDPLDGTRNFSDGVPFFAISVALMEARRPIFGAVYDPIADEAFYAVRGAGAWLNGKPLSLPARGPELDGALAEVSLHREAGELRNTLKKHPPYRRRITSGSSALSWCHLAAARTDLYLHSGQMAWDFAAGALVLEEAGGRLATLHDDDFWASSAIRRSVIAARTPDLFASIRDWVRRALPQ
jgi:fructose-1,6-bisphosphatase/inositol monophosphatase family enzyme